MLLPGNRVCASLARYWATRNCHKVVFQSFSTTAPVEIRSKNSRYRFRRPGHTALLERFVKQTSVDGSLIARAPFHLKCSASFFDKEGNVDTARNYKIGLQRDESNRLEKVNRRKETKQELEDEILSEDNQAGADTGQDNGAGVFMEMEDISLMRDVSEVEMKILDNLANSTTQDMVDNINTRARTPLQVSLYGRTCHRVDSYSILSGKMSHSHVYISDATSSEEALSMFSLDSSGGPTSVSPSGSVSIWRPREISQMEISSGLWDGSVPEEVASSVKVYCPSHLLDQRNSGITSVFYTPTLMNKIYLEAEKHGSIDLNCNLMDQLVSVGLVTQFGNIKLKDIWAQDIKLATRTGDILCYGAIEGNITAETAADGDFIARSVVGPRLKVTTDAGDICVWDDCHAEVSELYTMYGDVHCKRLYGTAKILIKEQGTATLNVIDGSVAVVVKTGDIVAHVDKISEDSFMEVETGNIVLHVAPDFPFRISLLAQRTTISPHILNSGEFFLSNGYEHFVSGVETSSAEVQPTLTIRCHHGQITLQGPRPSKTAETGFDSS
eukprot:GFUD01015279.1.p1 GENE.GFUD01015279.1~~GFUD01015279.1.p1  ORF type:complete len:576 (-),score=147.94 GFUD01015279.1:103-1767(-)